MLVAQSCLTLCDIVDRLLCPWNSPGKNTGVGNHSLHQGIFLTQGLKLGLLHCGQILYRLSHQGSPHITLLYIKWASLVKVKAIVFPVVMNGCESWTVKKAECQRIGAFELWCWRRLLRVPWITGRSNQSVLKEISPEYSLEGLMLKLKL